MPLQDPSVPQVVAPLSVHWSSGSSPAGTAVQAPALPVSAHDWHVPVQSVAQQTPCAQIPEAHEEGSVQGVPFAAPPGAASASAGLPQTTCPAGSTLVVMSTQPLRSQPGPGADVP